MAARGLGRFAAPSVSRAVGTALGAALLGSTLVSACGADAPALEPDAGVSSGGASEPSGPWRCREVEPPYALTAGRALADDALRESDPRAPLLRELRQCDQPERAPRVLALRVTAGFCGNCQLSARHTAALRVPGVQWIDVLVRDVDGAPPTEQDAEAWAALRDVPRDEVPVYLDPPLRFAYADAVATLPMMLLVRTDTMKLVVALSDPEPEALRQRLADLVLQSDGQPIPPRAPHKPELVDERFAPHVWQMIKDMALPEDLAPPADPTNRVADDPRAAALGEQLFFDRALAGPGTVSCGSCHLPDKAFADGQAQAIGVAQGDRNAPSVVTAAHQRWQFWDGRVDTSWAQALLPLEDPREHGGSRLQVVQRLAAQYREPFEALFGPLPEVAELPARGKPGDAAWEALPSATQLEVTRAFVGAGKAIAAYERTLRPEPTRFDRYARGELSALSDEEKDGLELFFISGCSQCHYGPRLTDDAFHVLRFATGRRDGKADEGRLPGLLRYRDAEFGASSVHSDAPQPPRRALAHLGAPELLGQFKTPSLRGVTLTAPYGHGGEEANLRVVVDRYGAAELRPGDARTVGQREPWVPQFDYIARGKVTAFLQALAPEAPAE